MYETNRPYITNVARREENVSETMYKETTPNKPVAGKNHHSSESQTHVLEARADSKVNKICDGFIAVLEQETYRDDHFQNIITAHVCKSPSDLDTALEMIGQLQGMDLGCEKIIQTVC